MALLSIGDYAVLAFHDVQHPLEAIRVMQEKKIDAAVVDHQYVFSTLQLGAALDRLHCGAVTMTTVATPHKSTLHQEGRVVGPTVYVALALTHDLEKIKATLAPTESCRSVIVVLKEPDAAVLGSVRTAWHEAGGKEHPLQAPTGSDRCSLLMPYASLESILSFYQIPSEEYRYWETNLAPSGEPDPCRLTALESCVVGRLSSYDC